MILTTFAIYQAQEHSRKQSCMAEPGMPKKSEHVNLSSCFPGLIQDCLDFSSQLGYDSTPFCRTHVHGTLVLLVSDVYYLKYLAHITISSYAWYSILLSYVRYGRV